jgi:glucose/arabinose dehydrogenase
VEVVATGLTYPSGVAFDVQGNPFVIEAGFSYGIEPLTPRLLRIGPGGSVTEVARGDPASAPWNGIDHANGHFYVSAAGHKAGGRIVRIDAAGTQTTLVGGLPSFGDHHTNGPVVGPDGAIYFSQGTATNSGVVGKDSADFGWLQEHPEFHDVPARDVVLRGVNYTTPDVRTGGMGEQVLTGAFVPYGTRTQPGQVVPGALLASGTIMRIKPDGSDLQMVAWGLRNPFGVAFTASGQLYATDNGYDERGSRPVFGTGDCLWRVEPGVWYGWPDYTAGLPISQQDYSGPCSPCPEKLLLHDPNPPPKPVAILEVHSASNGLDFSRNPAFGYVGNAFIAQFGDMAGGVGKVMNPVGFKVVRVDVNTGMIEDFAVSRAPRHGPASKICGCGLERPVAVRFDPSGTALYVVDFGVMTTVGDKPQPRPGTGALWKITRVHGPTGGVR